MKGFSKFKKIPDTTLLRFPCKANPIIAVIKPDVASAAVRDISNPYDKNNRVGETNKIIINKNLKIPGYNLSSPVLEDFLSMFSKSKITNIKGK